MLATRCAMRRKDRRTSRCSPMRAPAPDRDFDALCNLLLSVAIHLRDTNPATRRSATATLIRLDWVGRLLPELPSKASMAPPEQPRHDDREQLPSTRESTRPFEDVGNDRALSDSLETPFVLPNALSPHLGALHEAPARRD